MADNATIPIVSALRPYGRACQMGSRELVEGLLWRARAGIRVEGSLRAGHGMADAAYRPPALPYASVIGPLNIELEPERDLPRTVFLPVQAPGYLAGAERVAATGPRRRPDACGSTATSSSAPTWTSARWPDSP